jgi:hypothetical protein
MNRWRDFSLPLILAAACAASGCFDPWIDYEESLYASLRVPGPESYASHSDLLGEVVTYYEEKGRKPPPGILAERGLYLARLGRTDEAKRYLKAEVEAYPESARFVAALERIIEGHRAFQREEAP